MGNILPAYGFINADVYKAIQPKDAPKILYGIKANQSLKGAGFLSALFLFSFEKKIRNCTMNKYLFSG